MSRFLAEGYIAASDISSHQYKFVKNTTANFTVDLVTTAGGVTTGVLDNKPQLGEDATVKIGGLVRVFAGGTITAGDQFSSTASATAQKTGVGSADYAIGEAYTSAASGEIFQAHITHAGQTT